jgi:hypothetical protein
MHQRALRSYEKALGPDHTSTLQIFNNLGNLYKDQGRWKEAEDLEVVVMETRKRVSGQEHSHTLTSMAHLASTYRNQGRWKEAEEELGNEDDPDWGGDTGWLPHSVDPPEMLAAAIGDCKPDVIHTLLANDFESVAQKDYSWLHELVEIGFNSEEIAGLLLKEANDSPWIIFEGQVSEELRIDTAYHQRSCVHQGGQNLSSSPKLIGSTSQKGTVGLFMAWDFSAQEQTIRTVQELCGIGGIAPTSPDRSKWNGFAKFEDDHTLVSVSYTIPGEPEFEATTRILQSVVRTLRGVYNAVSKVQRAGLMCESFTVLCGSSNPSETTNVELYRINLAQISDFKEDLVSFLKNTDTRKIPLLIKEAQRILSLFHFISLEATVHLCSLVTQFICLGFLSYTQAHSGSIQPFLSRWAVKAHNPTWNFEHR